MGSTNRFLHAVKDQATANPDAVAYRIASEGATTYSQLWQRACALGLEIASTVSSHQPFVVIGPKSSWTISAFLGCLLSGHAFVPVDAELPAARILEILDQLDGTPVLRTCELSSGLSQALEGASVVDVRRVVKRALASEIAEDDGGPIAPPEDMWISGENVEYIIFTSGSTGKPKGIQVTANNVCDLMDWMRTFPVVGDGGRVFLDQAHYSFDLSEYQLVGALSTGGELYAVPDDIAECMGELFDDLAESGVEVWVSTPSFATICAADPAFDEKLLPNLKMFLFCGEALHASTAKILRERFPHAIIANTYGPTEATVAVTYREVTDEDIASGEKSLPVGTPRPGTEIRIASRETGEACKAGESGEIVIVGRSVSRGYLNNPEKNAAAFFETELSDGTPVRAFRTGDAGFVDDAGVLHCSGRFASFIKLNGYRIELEEVEGTLDSLPGVEAAAVVPHERGGVIRNLKAFVKLAQGGEAAFTGQTDFEIVQDIRTMLGKSLPAYMIPRTIKIVEDIPLTANGKIDRKALQAR